MSDMLTSIMDYYPVIGGVMGVITFFGMLVLLEFDGTGDAADFLGPIFMGLFAVLFWPIAILFIAWALCRETMKGSD